MTRIEPQHHKYSASGAKKWMTCAGAVAMERGIPDTSSAAADDGSASHFLGAECLQKGLDVIGHLGSRIVCWSQEGERDGQSFEHKALPEGVVVNSVWDVDHERAGYIQGYCDFVRKAAAGGELLIEERVCFGGAVGIPGAFGTSDVVVIKSKTLVIIDLKYGYTPVTADENPQLQLYALGALEDLGMVYDLSEVEEVQLVIFQPRIENTSTWSTTVADLYLFAEKVTLAAQRSDEASALYENPYSTFDTDEWEDEYLAPSEEGCRWCKAKGKCRALAKSCLTEVTALGAASADGLEVIGDEVEDKDLVVAAVDRAIRFLPQMTFKELSAVYAAIGKINQWMDTVEAQMLTEMLNGEKSIDYKLIRGQAGHRKWANQTEIEAQMKSMRLKLDEMYEKKVISPAAAETLLKKARPKLWKKLEVGISRAEGKVKVVPTAHKSPSINPHDDDLAMLPILANFKADDLVPDLDDLI